MLADAALARVRLDATGEWVCWYPQDARKETRVFTDARAPSAPDEVQLLASGVCPLGHAVRAALVRPRASDLSDAEKNAKTTALAALRRHRLQPTSEDVLALMDLGASDALVEEFAEAWHARERRLRRRCEDGPRASRALLHPPAEFQDLLADERSCPGPDCQGFLRSEPRRVRLGLDEPMQWVFVCDLCGREEHAD